MWPLWRTILCTFLFVYHWDYRSLKSKKRFDIQNRTIVSSHCQITKMTWKWENLSCMLDKKFKDFSSSPFALWIFREQIVNSLLVSDCVLSKMLTRYSQISHLKAMTWLVSNTNPCFHKVFTNAFSECSTCLTISIHRSSITAYITALYSRTLYLVRLPVKQKLVISDLASHLHR